MAWTNTERALLVILVASLLVAGVVVAQSFLLTAGQGGTFDHEDGPAVTLGEDYGISGDNPFGTDGSVTIQDTTIDGPAGSSATLTDPSSAAPTLSSIDGNGGTLEASTDGIQTVGVNGSITSLTYRDTDLSDDQTTEFEVDGTGTLFVHGLPANDAVRVNRASGGDTVVATDGAGVAAIDISGGADLTLVEDGGGPTLSNPAPTGGESFSSPPVELSVDVSDPDFGTANENVTLEWYVDGSLEATTSATSNGTQTYESTATNGGTHEWHVVATDAVDKTDRSPSMGNHTYNLPNELRIYEETAPDTLIDTDEANVTVRFFTETGDEVIERHPSGGVADLQGLPTNSEFIVTIDAEGYYYRRIIVDSLIEQQDVFLLPSDEPAASIVFQLDDQTGRFPAEETRLYVERALNQSDDTSYRVIAGDRFGSSGEFPVPLQDDTRYRLRIENDQGETRALGAYTTSGDDRAVLPIGTVEIAADVDEDLVVQASIQQVADSATVNYDHQARVFVLDESQQTGSFNLSIVNETGAVVRPESTHDGPWGRYIETVPLPEYTEGDTYYVHVNATRNDEARDFRVPIGELPDWPSGWPIDPWVLQLIGYVSLVALMGLLTIWSPTIAAISGVAYASLLVALGIVPIPGIAIGVAGSVAVLYRLGGDV